MKEQVANNSGQVGKRIVLGLSSTGIGIGRVAREEQKKKKSDGWVMSCGNAGG
jgi:hypothetical protein